METASSPLVGTLLVTEDDPVLVRFYQQALQGVCRELVVEESANRALQLLERRPFDFLITDLKVAEKTGVDIIRFAVKQCPSIAILVASGYVSDSEFREKLASFKNIHGFLQKPFTLTTLLEKIRSVIDSAGIFQDQ